MNPEELIDLIADISQKRKETVYYFIENARNCKHQDRGIEGWFQTELIAELQKQGKKVEHTHGGPDLKIDNEVEIELKMTTCFRPDWIIDGLIEYKQKVPVLFFSGYLDFWNKENPDFEKEDEVLKWFKEQIPKKNRRDDLNDKFGQANFSIRYRTVDLMNDTQGIAGIIESSKEISCEKI